MFRGVALPDLSLFVLFSMFSRPRAGLAIVLSIFFGLATNVIYLYAECEKQNKQQSEGLGAF